MPAIEDTTPAPAPGLINFPDTAERRLRRALRNLDVALAEQRAAVAAFRGQLAELNGAVGGLAETTRSFQGALAGAAAEVEKARHASRELTATAEIMERLARP